MNHSTSLLVFTANATFVQLVHHPTVIFLVPYLVLKICTNQSENPPPRSTPKHALLAALSKIAANQTPDRIFKWKLYQRIRLYQRSFQRPGTVSGLVGSERNELNHRCRHLLRQAAVNAKFCDGAQNPGSSKDCPACILYGWDFGVT